MRWPDSAGYVPYYELAARYKLPFVFHTGDTYSTHAKLKFAHPLLVDSPKSDLTPSLKIAPLIDAGSNIFLLRL